MKTLEQHILGMVKKIMPGLLEIAGVGPVAAGVLLAETADPKRLSVPIILPVTRGQPRWSVAADRTAAFQ